MAIKKINIVENILKVILLTILFVTPLLYTASLYYPYVSGKAYLFRFLVELALIPWIILLFKKPESRPNLKSPLVIALFIFVVALIITAFTGVDFRYSFFSNIERSDGIIQYIHWVFYFLMAISVFKTKKDWQIVLSLFISVALINSVYAFAHYTDQPRLFGLLGNSSFLGGFLIFAIGFCLLLALPSFSKKKNLRGLVAVLILLFTITLILTQTRGAYLGVFFGFFVFVVLANFYLWKKSLPAPARNTSHSDAGGRQAGRKTIIILNFILFIVLALSASIFIYKDSQFVKKFPIISRVAHTVESNSAKDRLSQWTTAVKGFKDKPILGWGPENFDVVANKYYNYRVGLYEPWFDRPHNQALQYLVEGGIVLFSAYLFLIAAVLFSIFKIYKREKVLASILLAIYVGYIIQSLILFDALPIFLGLFILFGFVYFKTNEDSVLIQNKHNYQINKNSAIFFPVLIISTIFIVFFEIQSVFIPIYGNRLIIDSFIVNVSKDYQKQSVLFDKLFSLQSSYLYLNIRRALGWDFGKNILDKDINSENKEAVLKLYNKIIPELENWLKYRPVDQQAYYILGTSYRIGFEKLGQQDALAKAEAVLKKALNYSNTRIEYIDELGQVLILQKKFDELDILMKNFAANIDVNDPYRYLSLGHSYFMQGKYDLTMQEYEKARSLGQQFWDSDRDYYRYSEVAEKLKDYQKIKDMAEVRLRNKGDDANSLFNLSVAELKLGDKKNAKINFDKAVKLDSSFEQYRSFFQ